MAALSFFIPDPAQARGTLCTGLIVAVVIAAIPIYDIPSWSLGKRSIVHFLVMSVTVFPLLLLAGWFNLPVSIAVFLVFGIIGWAVGYLVNFAQQKKSKPEAK